MSNANKTRSIVNNTYSTNRTNGLNKERELEILEERSHEFVSIHGSMQTNGTVEADDQIRRLREQVSNNVHQVLEGEKAQSMQVQTQQIDTRDTATQDQSSAITNKRMQSNVNQAVVDVIGGREHEAIKVTFEEEARFHESIKNQSAQDQQNLETKTRQTDQAINSTLNRLNSLL